MIRITVIIPFYNAHATIDRTISSIINQSGRNAIFTFSVIIIDDGSCKPLQNHFNIEPGITYELFRKRNGGAASARNFGLQRVKNSDFVAFLDADDCWHQEKTSRMLQVMKIGKYAMLGALSNSHKITKKDSQDTVEVKFYNQLLKNHFLTSTVLLNLKILDIKDVYFPFDQTHAEEGDLFLRITKSFKCAVLPVELVNYADGKKGFGASGLSGDMLKMQLGEVRNYTNCYTRKDISFLVYVGLLFFSFAKFSKRIISKNFL